ncbi:putative DCC family thiol-disulfide oxidoreductase YuxK [Melghirimyces profundicolus]|uniref:Putative DCC family thiol-disulfide oxidoreductase YuxK n=1 Tax=Melghirimyces profundicolus TaxID=1242148 RepID=A0A2T6BXK1_9BACL|nr:DCC1-like thiol-disulfide oxidoreductase family protein [Melghirimyces profundicolus]PTX60798.1 putative DCC family thiol-disulfide oxidoreductase YuxK [Melghirimyces profundicolus]
MRERLERFLTTKHLLIGTALTRIGLGAGVLFHLLYHYSERHLLWGGEGLWPTAKFLEGSEERGIWTLFHISESPWFFEGVYHLGILATLMFILGFKTRLATILTFLTVWSLYYRNPFVTNGGDNILRIQLFYLMFAQAGARFSLDRVFRKNKKPGRAEPCLSILHNAAVVAVILQLLFMYFTSGIYKVMGSMWQEGTAVYYAMRVQDYVWPGVSEWIWSSEARIVFLTYSSVLFQVAFPFLLLNRYTKYLAVAGAFAFHTGVGLMMNLALFSWYMISCEWILLTDRDYRRLARRWQRLRSKGGSLMEKHRPLFLTRQEVTVFYDGWCPFCTKSVRTARKLDWFRLLHFVSFREPHVVKTHNLDPDRLEKRLHSTRDGRRFCEGIDAIIQMGARLPLLWPVLPFLLLSKWLGLGQRVYDAIAARRTIIPTGACDEHCSLEDRKRTS